MSTSEANARWLPAASFAVGVMLALALNGLPTTIRRATGPSTAGAAGASTVEPSRRRILAPASPRRPEANGPRRQGTWTPRVPNLDPDAREPALRAEHLRLLAAEPFLQRLPYRDREVGVALLNVTPHGAPMLLVTFVGSLASARRDLWRALAEANDPGTEYALRYERVSR
jgi:hypothetical protein